MAKGGRAQYLSRRSRTGQLQPGLEVLGNGLVQQRALGVARVVEFGPAVGLRCGGVHRALSGSLHPLFGNALWMEYLDLLSRPVWGDATTADERHHVLAALARQGRWVTVYYGWRPSLPDEGDNHLIELALAGGAQVIVTHNLRDLRGGELQLGTLRVRTPAQCLEEWK